MEETKTAAAFAAGGNDAPGGMAAAAGESAGSAGGGAAGSAGGGAAGAAGYGSAGTGAAGAAGYGSAGYGAAGLAGVAAGGGAAAGGTGAAGLREPGASRMGAAGSAGALSELIGQIRQELLQNDPQLRYEREQLEAYRNREMEQTFERDLAAIKEAYPQERAGSIDELGPEFLAIMASGKVSPLAAYEAVLAEHRRRPPAPSMGDLATGGEKSGFFTPQEVRAMTPAQVEKHLDRILASQKRWRP